MGIADNMFENCTTLTTVKIPKSVKTIGAGAFHASGLKELSFEANSQVATIGNLAFKNCTHITSVSIPASVQKIGRDTFSFSGLSRVKFEPGSQLETIGDSAFAFTELKSINIPTCVTIGTEAFNNTGCDAQNFIGGNTIADCNVTDSITIPDINGHVNIPGNKAIPDYAFKHCKTLRSVFIPASVRAIGREAFSFSGLSHVEFAANSQLKFINGFKNTDKLESILIPAGVRTIGVFAFFESGLVSTSFKPGSQLKKIGDSAFKSTKLRTINIPVGVEVGIGAFNGTACAEKFKAGTIISNCEIVTKNPTLHPTKRSFSVKKSFKVPTLHLKGSKSKSKKAKF